MSRAAALSSYLAKWHAAECQPSVSDCAMLAAGWVTHLGGPDHACGFRGGYSTLQNGIDLLKAHGHSGLSDLMTKTLGPSLHWSQAEVGDIALIAVADDVGLAFGLVGAGRIHVLRPGRGLDALGIERALEVFRP